MPWRRQWSVFGPNHVFSNVIIGPGGVDQSLRQGIDELIDMGVLPILRAAILIPCAGAGG